MTDTLGWRLKLGVLAPSTNTSVQPAYDAMRPPGVTNHVRGFRIPNAPTRTDAEFAQQLENMRATMGRHGRGPQVTRPAVPLDDGRHSGSTSPDAPASAGKPLGFVGPSRTGSTASA
jgi:maleate isomerase